MVFQLQKCYPEPKKRVGNYRVEKLRTRFEALGYKVTTFPVEANGLDMIVENDREVLGIEVTNWNENGYLNLDRLSNMISNWNDLEFKLEHSGDKRDYRRILVYNYPSNIENLTPYLFEAKVELMKLGKQDIPPEEDIIEGWME